MLRMLAIVIATLLFSCSSYFSQVQFEYRGRPIYRKKLAIVYLSDISINYQGNVENEFGKGDQDSLISLFLESQIKLAFNDYSTFDYVWNDTLLNIKKLKIKEFYKGKKMVAFPVLDVKESIELSRRKAQYILFLNGLSLSSEITAHIMSGPVVGGVATKDLICSTEFMLWDNENLKPASFGKVKGEASQFLVSTRKGFDESANNMVKAILRRTAFSVAGDGDIY